MKSFTRPELDVLLAVARKRSETDYLTFLVTFNHGLRVSETLALTATNFVDGHLVVQRLKNSHKTTQPLLSDEADGLLALAQAANGGDSSRCIASRFGERYESTVPKRASHSLSAIPTVLNIPAVGWRISAAWASLKFRLTWAIVMGGTRWCICDPMSPRLQPLLRRRSRTEPMKRLLRQVFKRSFST